MWEIYINSVRVKELCSRHNYDPRRVTLTISTTVIRDGTPGISLMMRDDIVGEWTDSKANWLELVGDYKVIVHKADGDALYAIVAPGRVVAGEQVSDTSVSLILQFEE
jgi:hypothetical protein